MAQRPPSDITPQAFFETWLPAQLPAGQGTQAPLTVRVELEGDGGGAWDVQSGPGGVAVEPAGAGTPDVTLHQTVADWRAIIGGEPGAVSLAPPQASPTDLLFLDRTAQQIVQTTKGTFRFEVTGYNGRTWALSVKIGPQPLAAQPDATISVDAETYAAMLARTLPAPQAYFQGKVKIDGDATLAMQLAMALMPRFG
jgi:putative sterol carrier protein